MDNQQQSIIGAQYTIGQLNGVLLLLEINANKYKVQCNNCNTIYETSLSSLSRARKDNISFCKHCKPKLLPVSRKYEEGQIIACFKLVNPLGGNYWNVECIKCGKIQRQSIPNMKKRIKNECIYCTNENYVRNYNGGGGVVKYNLDERAFINYKSKINTNNKNSNRKYKEFNLSLEEYSNLVHDNCFYCGNEPSIDNTWNKSGKRLTQSNEIYTCNGIDRVDPNKGYYLENCVPCCTTCNRMKSDLDTNTFLLHIKKIISNNKCSTTIETT